MFFFFWEFQQLIASVNISVDVVSDCEGDHMQFVLDVSFTGDDAVFVDDALGEFGWDMVADEGRELR